MLRDVADDDVPEAPKTFFAQWKMVLGLLVAGASTIGGAGGYVALQKADAFATKKALEADHAAAVVEHNERVTATTKEHAFAVAAREEEHKDKAEVMGLIHALELRVLENETHLQHHGKVKR